MTLWKNFCCVALLLISVHSFAWQLPWHKTKEVYLTQATIIPSAASKFTHSSMMGLEVGSGFVVTLVPVQTKQPEVLVTRDKIPITWVQEKHGNLILERPKFMLSQKGRQPTYVTLYVPRLSRLIVRGNSQVTGNNVSTHHLCIATYDCAVVRLTNHIHVKRIEQYGSSQVYLRWVDNPKLSIVQNGNGIVSLAGITHALTARLAGMSQLQAHYLRAERAWILATEDSQAHISPWLQLAAFAKDRGLVAYYHDPKELIADTAESGNVLDFTPHR